MIAREPLNFPFALVEGGGLWYNKEATATDGESQTVVAGVVISPL